MMNDMIPQYPEWAPWRNGFRSLTNTMLNDLHYDAAYNGWVLLQFLPRSNGVGWHDMQHCWHVIKRVDMNDPEKAKDFCKSVVWLKGSSNPNKPT